MRDLFDTVRRIGILSLLALVVAHCGGSDVQVGPNTGVQPFEGVFRGTTSQGASIVIEVGSIEAVTFDCGTTRIQNLFAPPGEVDIDGTFDLRFEAADRTFRFKGQFSTNDDVEGNIDDDDDVCDVTFRACRGGCGTPTPVLTRTPTPTLTKTPTPTPAPVSTGPTLTPVGATPSETPTPQVQATETLTPTPTPTTTPPFCGNGTKDTGEDCDVGASFGAPSSDCPDDTYQCACCYCRPGPTSPSPVPAHGSPPSTSACIGCHQDKPPKNCGAVTTFDGTCNDGTCP